MIATTDYPTAGEPFRIVAQPRGHADMYGGFIVPPDDDGANPLLPGFVLR